MIVDEEGVARRWDVSIQKTWHTTSCARCHQIFAKGDLRLRPNGTSRTRLIHPACAHGLVDSVDSVVNRLQLTEAQQKSLQQSLAHAAAVPGAPGDVPMPAIDAAAVASMAANPHSPLRNMQQWDTVPWERAMECPSAVRNCPERWEASMLDAKMTVLRAIRLLTETGQGHSVESQRCWKLLSMFDAIMMSVMPRKRGSKRGQGLLVHEVNGIYSTRLRCFWSGAWVQLLSELDVAQQRTSAKPINKSESARLAQECSTIQSLLKGQAVSKAISRVASPMEFATGPTVPQQIWDKFPHAAPIAVQADVPDIDPELRDELKSNILSELMQLPKMTGAGPTGSYCGPLERPQHPRRATFNF